MTENSKSNPHPGLQPLGTPCILQAAFPYLNQRHSEQSGELPHADLAPLGLREGGRDEVAAHHARDEPISPPLDPALVEGEPRYEPETRVLADGDSIILMAL